MLSPNGEDPSACEDDAELRDEELECAKKIKIIIMSEFWGSTVLVSLS